MSATHEDHAEIALAQQRQVFRGPDHDALLRVLMRPFDDLEVAIRALLTAREQGLAGSGAALDEVGNKLRFRRGELDDEEYVIALRAQLARLCSGGSTEDILTVARVVLPPIPPIRVKRLTRLIIMYLPGTADFNVGMFALRNLRSQILPAVQAATAFQLAGGGVDETQVFRFASAIQLSASSAAGASTVTTNPESAAELAASGWLHPAGSGVVPYTLGGGGVLQLGAPLGAAVAAGDLVPVCRSDGAPLEAGLGWDQGRLKDVVAD